MEFKDFSKETVRQIDKALNRLLNEWRSEVGKINKSLLSVVDKFIKANEGGKRIRGVLVVLGYEIAKGRDHLGGVPSTSLRATIRGDLGEIIKVAAAYEIFHTAILAHDDIIDQSLLRRNQSSLYQALGGDHKGVSLAISLADAGLFLAGKIISETNFPDKQKNEALKYFFSIILNTAMGQILEIEKGESLTVAKYKTAQYSVSGPLVLGAILAKSHLGGVRAHLRGDQLLKDLAKFGENLGIAFQIQDDILDSEVAWIGGSDCAKKAAEKYKNEAMKILPQITKDQKMSKILEQMAGYLVERNK